MHWLQNSIVFIGSWIVVVISVLWSVSEGGFEPWIATVAGVVGIAANRHLLPSIGPKQSRLTPEQRIAARDKWRPIFENYFQEVGRIGRQSDAIVHDVNRLDQYPNSAGERGISAWFRIGLMGTYHRGILLGLRWTYLEQENGKWKENSAGASDGSIKAILLGAVPFDAIQSVNLEGDQFYNKPHIYCHFDYGGQPYERMFYGEEFRLDHESAYHYREIAPYVQKATSRWRFWRQKNA